MHPWELSRRNENAILILQAGIDSPDLAVKRSVRKVEHMSMEHVNYDRTASHSWSIHNQLRAMPLPNTEQGEFYFLVL